VAAGLSGYRGDDEQGSESDRQRKCCLDRAVMRWLLAGHQLQFNRRSVICHRS
jgi:hypothetical protein